MDHIDIINLEVFANHGVYEEEASLGQKFLVSAKLYFDAEPAGRSDDLNLSVNYAEACSDITEWMKTNRCRLIETAAQRLADKLLRDYKIVREVEVTIKKPWAPIGLPLECVSITITRRRHTAYLSIGSNMGDRRGYLLGGIEYLKKSGDVAIEALSSFITTKPYGKVDQDDFLNGVVKLETMLTADELLELVHKAEADAGRERKEHWGPRTLDMDILFYDDMIIEKEDLTIPHYDMINRDFVLRPLYEIAPTLVHPVLHKSIKSLLAELENRQATE